MRFLDATSYSGLIFDYRSDSKLNINASHYMPVTRSSKIKELPVTYERYLQFIVECIQYV